MKKYALLFITLILTILPLVACAKVSELIPQALASSTQSVVEQVKLESNDVYSEIQDNIDLTQSLKDKVQQAQINGKPLTLNDVINDIQKVSNSYNKLSSQHEAITKSILQKINRIEDMEKMVSQAIIDLQKRRTNYAQQLLNVHDPNPQIVKTRTEALQQAIRYTDQQILLWNNFLGIENDIANQMTTINASLNSFLSVIDSSATVYREGLNLLMLQKNLNDALSLFTADLPEIASLTNQMTQSWSNLDFLVTSLTNASSIGIPK